MKQVNTCFPDKLQLIFLLLSPEAKLRWDRTLLIVNEFLFKVTALTDIWMFYKAVTLETTSKNAQQETSP